MDNNEKKLDLSVAEPREIAEAAVKILDAKKAHNICLYHVSEQTVVADYYIVCDGNVKNQINSMADELEVKLAEAGIVPVHADGRNSDSWVLLDYGTVMVHVMLRSAREFYNIEKLWDASCEIDVSELLLP